MPKRVNSDTVARNVDVDGNLDAESTTDAVDLSLDPSVRSSTLATPGEVDVAGSDAEIGARVAEPVATSPSARARRLGGTAVAPSTTAVKSVKHDAVTLTKSPHVDENASAGETVRRGGLAGRQVTHKRPEPAAASPTPPARRRLRPTRTGIVAGALLALAVILGIVNVLVWHPWNQPDRVSEVRGQVLSTVNQSVADVISYSYKTWDADAKSAETGLGGQFKTDYANAMGGDLKKDAVSTQTVVVGKVNSSGVVSINKQGTEATVAVYAQTTKTNSANPEPTVGLLGIQVVVDKTDGKWLITKLNYIK